MNLPLALLTAKRTSVKWSSKKISCLSYKSTHVSSLRTFNRAPSFSLLGQKLCVSQPDLKALQTLKFSLHGDELQT